MVGLIFYCVLSASIGAVERAVEYNLAVPDLAAVDSLLTGEQEVDTATRVGLWARRYLEWGETFYRFGLAEGGYVERGLLVPGQRQDCISLLYRTTELARATDARDAVRVALAVRFAGADLDSVVGEDGRVDYGRPEHLDYSLDMIRSGHWGRDVTASLSGVAADLVGSSRYAPGSFEYVPEVSLVAGELREGDLAWLVLDAADPKARKLRDEYGLVVGHVGIVIVEDGEVWLVHAASSPLPGWYDHTGVVRVPLAEYLRRVERYGGVIVTRFGN